MRKTKRQNKALAVVNYDLFSLADRCPPAPATVYTRIRQHLQQSPPSEGVEALKLSGGALPDIDQLRHLFDVYNWTYFQGKLPRVGIEFSDRMKSAGSYLPGQKLIRIGRQYHEIFPEEIADTLKHEMIHIRHLKHDAVFKSEAQRIGASLKARSHTALRKPPRYIYVCKSCGCEYPRQRRLRMASCGRCTPGRQFDPRFKLKLQRSAHRPAR